jgi:hypothetical protein
MSALSKLTVAALFAGTALHAQQATLRQIPNALTADPTHYTVLYEKHRSPRAEDSLDHR